MSERYDVYFNLRKDVFSVRSCRSGRVVAHTRHIVLRDCTFVVQPAGQRKVRESGVKNVHAWIKGTRIEDINFEIPYVATAAPVYYNPFITDTFQTLDTKEAVHRAGLVLAEIWVDHKPQLFAWGIEQNKESAHAAQQG